MDVIDLAYTQVTSLYELSHVDLDTWAHLRGRPTSSYQPRCRLPHLLLLLDVAAIFSTWPRTPLPSCTACRIVVTVEHVSSCQLTPAHVLFVNDSHNCLDSLACHCTVG